MNAQHILERAGCVLVATFVTLALSSCSTSRHQPDATRSVTNTAPSAAAQGRTDTTKSKPAKRATRSAEISIKSTSAGILPEIHEADLKEIALGQIAQGKASTDELREYANQLVEDRTSAESAGDCDSEEKEPASARIRHPKVERTRPAQRLSGPLFDKSFLQQTAADHDKLLRSLGKEREDASDDHIEALIDEILPILEQDQALTQFLTKKEQA